MLLDRQGHKVTLERRDATARLVLLDRKVRKAQLVVQVQRVTRELRAERATLELQVATARMVLPVLLDHKVERVERATLELREATVRMVLPVLLVVLVHADREAFQMQRLLCASRPSKAIQG